MIKLTSDERFGLILNISTKLLPSVYEKSDRDTPNEQVAAYVVDLAKAVIDVAIYTVDEPVEADNETEVDKCFNDPLDEDAMNKAIGFGDEE